MLGYYPDSLLMNGKSSAQNAGVVGEPEEGKETARVWVQDDWVPTRAVFLPWKCTVSATGLRACLQDEPIGVPTHSWRGGPLRCQGLLP